MHLVVKQPATQRKVTQRYRFTRKSPVVAAATVLPKFTLFKFWAPPHRFAWFGRETLEPLRHFSFSFTLRMDPAGPDP